MRRQSLRVKGVRSGQSPVVCSAQRGPSVNRRLSNGRWRFQCYRSFFSKGNRRDAPAGDRPAGIDLLQDCGMLEIGPYSTSVR